jgi:hypothetical protein
MSIPPYIPSGMLSTFYSVKSKMGVLKQALNCSFSGQNTATHGQKVIVSLPPNSWAEPKNDLSTFEMNLTGATQHRGINAATHVANYVQKAYFPRNTLIENLEIKTRLRNPDPGIWGGRAGKTDHT